MQEHKALTEEHKKTCSRAGRTIEPVVASQDMLDDGRKKAEASVKKDKSQGAASEKLEEALDAVPCMQGYGKKKRAASVSGRRTIYGESAAYEVQRNPPVGVVSLHRAFEHRVPH